MAAPTVRLIPLVCVQCRHPVPAQPGEVAWVCQTCGSGNLLSEDGQVSALPVFYSPGLRPGAQGRPFWVAQGRVTITDRQTYKGNEARKSSEFWAGPRLFFIPAFQMGLDDLVAAGMKMLRDGAGPAPQPGGGLPFLPVTTPPDDMQPLVEFIVLALEAARSDALKTVSFQVSLETPQLWVLE